MNIVWLEADSMGVPLPRPQGPHQWQEYPFTTPDQLPARLADAQVLIVNKVKIGAAELAAAPKLRMIQITATGTDNVDKAACEQRGVVLRNVANYGPESVAEHVIACLLQLTRRVPEWQELVKQGAWSASRFFCLHTLPMKSLSQLSLAIVGSGAIGDKVAHFAQAFGMHVMRAERRGSAQVRAGYTAFEEALAKADAISLHCPLTPDTAGLMGPAEFAAMKPGALLINTARGGLVQFDALKQALESGQLGGAALDVLDIEPPPSDHAMLAWHHPRCIITPHVAWATEQAQRNLGQIAIAQVEVFLAEQGA